MILKKNINPKNNMKNVLLVLLVLLTLDSYSQVGTLPQLFRSTIYVDTVKIPQLELDEFFLSLDILEQQDSIKSILILDLETQIKNYNFLSQQDSLILNYKNQELVLLKNQINLYDNRLSQIDKWYYKPWVGFVGGIATSVLMIHIIDYSLPK
jgi:hypothetical protein|tara:strand:- start:214 stop:672 length:459 start_codon:yes stop_codon:yes gene_type:complete